MSMMPAATDCYIGAISMENSSPAAGSTAPQIFLSHQPMPPGHPSLPALRQRSEEKRSDFNRSRPDQIRRYREQQFDPVWQK